jgi:hypothetical protein
MKGVIGATLSIREDGREPGGTTSQAVTEIHTTSRPIHVKAKHVWGSSPSGRGQGGAKGGHGGGALEDGSTGLATAVTATAVGADANESTYLPFRVVARGGRAYQSQGESAGASSPVASYMCIQFQPWDGASSPKPGDDKPCPASKRQRLLPSMAGLLMRRGAKSPSRATAGASSSAAGASLPSLPQPCDASKAPSPPLQQPSSPLATAPLVSNEQPSVAPSPFARLPGAAPLGAPGPRAGGASRGAPGGGGASGSALGIGAAEVAADDVRNEVDWQLILPLEAQEAYDLLEGLADDVYYDVGDDLPMS